MTHEKEFLDYVELNKKEVFKNTLETKNVYIDLEDLIQQAPNFSEELLKNPEEEILTIKKLILELNIVNHVNIRFYNVPDYLKKNIRDIRSKDLNSLICFEGIIRQVGNVESIIIKSKFECPSCGSIINLPQKDDVVHEPNKCSCGRKNGFRLLENKLEDIQNLIIEEKHEDTDTNQQPQRIKTILRGNLCEPKIIKKNFPGSLVKIIGILSEKKKYIRGNNVSTILEKYVSINNIEYINFDDDEIEITEEEKEKFYNLAKSPNALEIITNSIAPSIYGYNNIKKAIALQLIGGVKNKRSDGSFTRANIHGLIVGDPGLSKSVMLKFTSSVLPRSRFVSGRGSSGVGLTASVIKSEISGDYVLEGGPLIMANGSIMAIDEGEKMKADDITNLHEAMSIGTLTINKANIHSVLPAETSILMAANPKHGRFKIDDNVLDQINLPPSFVSRFDFIYVIKDKPNEDKDNLIASKIFEEHSSEQFNQNILEKDDLKKYIIMARHMKPKMTEEAKNEMKNFYVELRKQSKEMGDGSLIIPITPRQLEALIRLSQAHAKLKLRENIGIDDAKQAIKVYKEYLLEFGYDEKANAFDIDKIMGTSSSTRTKMDAVLKTVRILETNFENGYVPLEEIEQTLKDNLTSDEVYSIVMRLNQSGDLIRNNRRYKRT